jgi:hypothetical protein
LKETPPQEPKEESGEQEAEAGDGE